MVTTAAIVLLFAQAPCQPTDALGRLTDRVEALRVVAQIQDELPAMAEATDVLGSPKGLTTNDPLCDKAAGIVYGRMKALGLDARLVEAAIHITVRVKTADGDVIIDPTMAQFFTDGTPTDDLLRKKGGFVGTESQLRAFLIEHADDWNGEHGPHQTFPELSKSMREQGVTDRELADYRTRFFLPDFEADAMHLFEANPVLESRDGGTLKQSAESVATDYATFKAGGDVSELRRRAFSRLP